MNMVYMKLGDICSPKQWKTISTSELTSEGYPVYGANGIIGYYKEFNHIKETILVTCRGATCGSVNITRPYSYVNGNAMALDNLDERFDINYLYFYLSYRGFNDVISGSAQPQIIRSAIEKILIPLYPIEQQRKIASLFIKINNIHDLYRKENDRLDELIKIPLYPIEQQRKIASLFIKINNIHDLYRKENDRLDELIKSRFRFVEMFGDLKTNSKGWRIVGFKECADIDTNMVHDFKGYEDYPHIGIDSIEKETGKLIGYRTIAEDSVISGKYLFTPAHIIYSKIRPNLNKVAMPEFDGLCSADAYPILVKQGVCNREFFGYTLRSKYFLDYILSYSGRTNLPKVNKSQVEGFTLPLPPMELQEQFATFVNGVDKLKVSVSWI